MHELAVCQGLMNQVDEIARRENAQLVTRITLLIGPLSGIEPQLLRDAFPIAAAGSVAEDAQLSIEEQAIEKLGAEETRSIFDEVRAAINSIRNAGSNAKSLTRFFR